MISDYTYEGVRRVAYPDPSGECGDALFVQVCSTCGRFVKADQTIRCGYDGLAPGPNATCKRCGRVEMVFEGFFSKGEFGYE